MKSINLGTNKANSYECYLLLNIQRGSQIVLMGPTDTHVAQIWSS